MINLLFRFKCELYCKRHTSMSFKSMFVFAPYCQEAIKSNQSSTYIDFQRLRRGSFYKWFQLSCYQFKQRMTNKRFQIN